MRSFKVFFRNGPAIPSVLLAQRLGFQSPATGSTIARGPLEITHGRVGAPETVQHTTSAPTRFRRVTSRADTLRIAFAKRGSLRGRYAAQSRREPRHATRAAAAHQVPRFHRRPLITAPDAVAAAGYGDGCARRQFLSWRCVVHRRRRRRTWSANPNVDRSCRRRRGYREQRRRAGLRLRRRAIECSAAFRGFDGMCRWWKFRTCSHAAPKNEAASELHQRRTFTKLIRPPRINLLAFASRAAVAFAARSAAAAERRAGPSASRRSHSSLRRICPQRVNP